MPILNRKCNYCGALIDQNKLDLFKKCEYCGQPLSQTNKYFIVIRDVINFFKKVQFKPKSIKVSQSTKNFLIISSASLFSILIISELAKERWFKVVAYRDVDSIHYIQFKKGEWYPKKTYRNFSYRIKFYENEDIDSKNYNPKIYNKVVDCINWRESEKVFPRKWRKIRIGSNWHRAMEIICEKPKSRWIRQFFEDGGNIERNQGKYYIRLGFWLENKKFRTFDLKSKKKSEKAKILKYLLFDCRNWKYKLPYSDSDWEYIKDKSAMNFYGKTICEDDFNFNFFE